MQRTLRSVAVFAVLALFAAACSMSGREAADPAVGGVQQPATGDPSVAGPADAASPVAAVPGKGKKGKGPKKGKATGGKGGGNGGGGGAGGGGGGGGVAATAGGGGGGAPVAGPQAPGGKAPTAAQRAQEVRAPGIEADRIKIGYLVPDKDWDGVYTAIGLPGNEKVGFGDQRKMWQTVIDHTNANGGIAGRKIEPYFFTYSFNRTLDPASAAAHGQEACSYWTQDNRVFAVFQVGFENWSLMDCLVKNKVVHVNTSTFVSGGFYQSVADYFYNFTFNSLDRQLVDYAYGLEHQGFFGSRTKFDPATSKIGLVWSDTNLAFERAIKDGLEPQLAKYGLKIAARAGTSSGDFTNHVVNFRQAGVTHVIYATSSPITYALFMQAAENQRYRPWHGISTAAVPGPLLQYIAPRPQLALSMGPGWSPLADLEKSENPYPDSPAEKVCRQIMDRNGLSTDDSLERALQHASCLLQWIVGEGITRSAPNLTPQGLGQQVAANGRSFWGAKGLAFPYRLGADRVNNGVAGFRPMYFETSCNCYRYEGKITRMP